MITSKENPKSFERPWFFKVWNTSKLLRIGPDTVLINEEYKNQSLSFSEVELFRIQEEPSFADAIEHDTEAFIVLLKCLPRDYCHPNSTYKYPI